MSYQPVWQERTSQVRRDVFSQVLGSDATALPILDIHQKWQDVAVSAVFACFCTVPGFNVPASGYFLWCLDLNLTTSGLNVGLKGSFWLAFRGISQPIKGSCELERTCATV